MTQKVLVAYATKHGQKLAARDVWLFSSGPTGEGDPVENLQGWRLPESLQPVAERIQPHEIAVFHGSLALDDLNFLEKWAIKNVKAPVGDFRDWEMITAWAQSITELLKATETA